jgi:hypothetical protein
MIYVNFGERRDTSGTKFYTMLEAFMYVVETMLNNPIELIPFKVQPDNRMVVFDAKADRICWVEEIYDLS